MNNKKNNSFHDFADALYHNNMRERVKRNAALTREFKGSNSQGNDEASSSEFHRALVKAARD